jgi:anti-sigma B factor antagonist
LKENTVSTVRLSWVSNAAAIPAPRWQRFCMTGRSTPPGSVVITVCGEVDHVSGPLLYTRLEANIHQAGPDLVVDLVGVSFLGVPGLTALMAARTAAAAAGIEFCVIARTRMVLRPLKVVGVDTVFDVAPTASVRQPQP